MAVPESGPGSGGAVGPGAARASSRSLRTDPGLEQASGPPALAPPVPAPTPLLDAALKRAEAEERLQREAIRAQQSAPDPSPAGGPKVQTVSVVTRPRGRDPETASPGPVQPRQASFIGSKPQARPASLKEQPQPEIPPAQDGESDLVAAPLVPEPASAKPADPAAVWAESLDRLKTIARESARQPGAGRGRGLVAASLPGGGVAGQRDAPARQPGPAPKGGGFDGGRHHDTCRGRHHTVRRDPLRGARSRGSGSPRHHRAAALPQGARVRSVRAARRSGAQAGTAGHPLLRAVRPALPDRGPELCFPAVVEGRARDGQRTA